MKLNAGLSFYPLQDDDLPLIHDVIGELVIAG